VARLGEKRKKERQRREENDNKIPNGTIMTIRQCAGLHCAAARRTHEYFFPFTEFCRLSGNLFPGDPTGRGTRVILIEGERRKFIEGGFVGCVLAAVSRQSP